MQSINKSFQNLFRMYSENDCSHPFYCYHHFSPGSWRQCPHWLSLLFPFSLFSTYQLEWSFKSLTQRTHHVMPLLKILPYCPDSLKVSPEFSQGPKGYLQVPFCSNICYLCLCWLCCSHTPCLRVAQTLQTNSSPTALAMVCFSAWNHLPQVDSTISLLWRIIFSVKFSLTNEWVNDVHFHEIVTSIKRV